jgi:hypothetical protein
MYQTTSMVRLFFYRIKNSSSRYIKNFEFIWSEVKWVKVKFLGSKVSCTVEWPYTENTWLYCDYFICCVSCTVVVLICFVMCGRSDNCVCFFRNMYACICCVLYCLYCILYCLYCVFVMYRLCIFIPICFVCTGVRTTATEWRSWLQALCYKPEGRGFDFRWCHWNISLA